MEEILPSDVDMISKIVSRRTGKGWFD
jgi:hypothetical protein